MGSSFLQNDLSHSPGNPLCSSVCLETPLCHLSAPIKGFFVFSLSSGDGGYARDARLKAPSSLAVAPNGTLYIADLGNIRIRAVSPNQPQPNSAGLVEISSPLDQELYLFNQVRCVKLQLCHAKCYSAYFLCFVDSYI